MDQNLNFSPKLRTQQLINPRYVGIRLGWFIIVPLICTIIGILIAVPLMMILQRIGQSSATKQLTAEARAKFPAFIGRPTKYMDVAMCGYGTNLSKASASGMAYADGRLYILEEGVAAEIPWDDIRTWTWNINGHSVTELYGRSNVGIEMQVAQSNANAKAVAHRASGFTIKTANIDKPDWRFQTADEEVLKKWMEILTQMKEGRIPRA